MARFRKKTARIPLVVGAMALLAACENPVTIPDRDSVPPGAFASLVFGGQTLCVDTRPESSASCTNGDPDIIQVIGAINSDQMTVVGSGFDDGGIRAIYLCALNGSFNNFSANARVVSTPPPGFEQCLTRSGSTARPTDALTIAGRFRRSDRSRNSLVQVDVTDFNGNANSAIIQIVPR